MVSHLSETRLGVKFFYSAFSRVVRASADVSSTAWPSPAAAAGSEASWRGPCSLWSSVCPGKKPVKKKTNTKSSRPSWIWSTARSVSGGGRELHAAGFKSYRERLTQPRGKVGQRQQQLINCQETAWHRDAEGVESEICDRMWRSTREMKR